MPENTTAADVDTYIASKLIPPDAALDAALQSSAAGALPAISVSAAQGKFLHLLATIAGAKRILEIGTLGGYSTIWLARALPPGGKLISLELMPHHADVARANVARAGLAQLVDIRVGQAIDLLPTLTHEAPFDLTFIDADKPSIAAYFDWAVRLSRTGATIIADNVVRNGQVIDAANPDPAVIGVRSLYDAVSHDPRVTATTLQTVGSKGYDGFLMAVVK